MAQILGKLIVLTEFFTIMCFDNIIFTEFLYFYLITMTHDYDSIITII